MACHITAEQAFALVGLRKAASVQRLTKAAIKEHEISLHDILTKTNITIKLMKTKLLYSVEELIDADLDGSFIASKKCTVEDLEGRWHTALSKWTMFDLAKTGIKTAAELKVLGITDVRDMRGLFRDAFVQMAMPPEEWKQMGLSLNDMRVLKFQPRDFAMMPGWGFEPVKNTFEFNDISMKFIGFPVQPHHHHHLTRAPPPESMLRPFSQMSVTHSSAADAAADVDLADSPPHVAAAPNAEHLRFVQMCKDMNNDDAQRTALRTMMRGPPRAKSSAAVSAPVVSARRW